MKIGLHRPFLLPVRLSAGGNCVCPGCGKTGSFHCADNAPVAGKVKAANSAMLNTPLILFANEQVLK
jgi:hypothetical protein